MTGGQRVTQDLLSGVQERSQWLGADLDVTLPGRAYLNLSYEGDSGGLSPMQQAYFGLSWRF